MKFRFITALAVFCVLGYTVRCNAWQFHWQPVYQEFESKTEAELKVSTPTVVGKPYYDSTNKAVIITTGTANCFQYGQINAGGTAPAGW